MKFIPLTQGKRAMVDDCDHAVLSEHKWAAWRTKKKTHDVWYAVRTVRSNGKKTTIQMHTQITGVQGSDHRDCNGLNNQRKNLRPANSSQNKANSRKCRGKSSRFKGVWWNKMDGVWHAGIQGRHIGSFAKEKEAARAYDVAARKAFGEFARTNFRQP